MTFFQQGGEHAFRTEDHYLRGAGVVVEYYNQGLDQVTRALILASAFSIDLDFFESSKGGANMMPG